MLNGSSRTHTDEKQQDEQDERDMRARSASALGLGPRDPEHRVGTLTNLSGRHLTLCLVTNTGPGEAGSNVRRASVRQVPFAPETR